MAECNESQDESNSAKFKEDHLTENRANNAKYKKDHLTENRAVDNMENKG